MSNETPETPELREIATLAYRAPKVGAGDTAADEIERLRDLLRRGMRQLALWHEKYGDNGPDWIPPAGDVRWIEDACDAMKTPNAKSEGAEPLLAKLPLD